MFTAYGAVPFVADSAALMREAARVLRPGGRFVFSTTHPFRWAFPDDPESGGLTVTMSYFDRTPYVEADSDGEATYVEHHRTIGDRVREIVAAGLVLVDLVEPEWPERNDRDLGRLVAAARGGSSPVRRSSCASGRPDASPEAPPALDERRRRGRSSLLRGPAGTAPVVAPRTRTRRRRRGT